MAENNNGRITGMLLSKSRRAQYIRVFAVLAACVVLAVVVVLHQIGIAMTHEERVLTCPIADVVLHTHNDDCYDADGNLVCNLPIHVLHTHNADCYDSDGNLVCVLPELELHTHGDDCYTEVRELTCGLEESKDHVHTDDCYKVTRVLTCGKEEVKLHTHNEDCYTEVRELTCGLEESKDHVHTDDCYKVTRVLTCGKEEVLEEHVHGPGCFTTITVEDKEEQNDEQSSDDQSSDAENTAAEVVTQNAMPAQEFEGEILDQDGKLWLHVSVKAPEGAFPAGTTMEVAYVKSSDVEGVVSKTIADAGDKREVDSTQAVDIVFRNADGVEIEPLCPITVSMTSDKIADGNTNPVLVHVDDNGKGEVVDQLSDRQAVERKVETGNDTLAFDADAFSVYVIAYTVDFHWDVDGETYDFSIPGGGFVSFTDLIEVLGIAEGTYSEGIAEDDALTLSNTTVSDKTKKFVADVKSVEFSNPDLVWVGKVEADSTVGDLKKANGLDVQYSAELSEEQIQQINAQTVKSGDWALISKLPFLSEESLTVTMNNGEVFTIKVTDAQYAATKTTELNGKTGALINNNGYNERFLQNSLQSSAHPTEYGRLKAADVTISNGRIATTDSSESLTRWTFEKVEGQEGNWYYIYDASIESEGNRYLNIVDNSLFMRGPQPLYVNTNMDGRIRIQATNNVKDYNRAVNCVDNITENGYSAYNSKWTGNPGEWFDFYEIEEVFPVTLHFVKGDRSSFAAGEVTYADGTPVEVVDGNFKIDPTKLEIGSDGIIALSQFKINGYTLSNTHKSTQEDINDSNDNYRHSIIGNELKWNNGTVQYKLYYTNHDKAGWDWFDAGTEPKRDTSSYWQYDSNSGTNPSNPPTEIDNDKKPYDYFLVYDPIPSSSGSGSGGVGSLPEGDSIDGLGKSKKLTPNGDGTYTMDLSVTTHATGHEESNGINLLIVFDTSSSMRRSTTKWDKEYENGKKEWHQYSQDEFKSKNDCRFMQAKNALDSFLTDLCPTDNATTNAVQLALVDFNEQAHEHKFGDSYWTNNPSTFMNTLGDLTCPQGTNWAQALKKAQEIAKKADDDPTYILFMTDGAPSQYWGEDILEQLYFVSGQGCYLGARDDARRVVGAGLELYGIFSFGDEDDENNGYLSELVDYAYNAKVRENHSFYASDSQKLVDALRSIFGILKEKVAHIAVNYHDGIALDTTSTALSANVDGTLGSITYSKTGGTTPNYTVKTNRNGDATFIIDGTEHLGTKTTNTYTRLSGSSTDVAGITTTTATANVYSCTVGTGNDAKTYYMPIASLVTNPTTRIADLNWDLSSLGLLEDGATYKISFVVWPDQEAYDYVADLNNEIKRWDTDTQTAVYASDGTTVLYYKNGAAQYPNIVYYPSTNTYAALTNTSQDVTYYVAKEDRFNSNTEINYSGQYTTYPDTPDPMPLTASKAQIEKIWNVERDLGILAQLLYNYDDYNGGIRLYEYGDKSEPYHIDFEILRGVEKSHYTNVTLGWHWYNDDDHEEGGYFSWDEGSVRPHTFTTGKTVQVGTRWVEDFSIATGLMLSEDRMDALELDKNAYPSAKLGNVTYYILEDGHDYTIAEPELMYQFDFSAPVYHPMLVDGVLKNVSIAKTGTGGNANYSISDMVAISVDSAGKSSLKVENTLRGYINLKKVVVDLNGKTRMEDDNTKFTYDVVLENESGPFTIEGDHVPWYGINGLYYHTLDADGNVDNYYQADIDYVNPDNGLSYITLKDEAENNYPATSPNFNESAGPATLTYTDNTGAEKTIQLFGNQMKRQNDSEVSATLKITQNQTLSIANVPSGTRYSITEANEAGYELVKIEKEIRVNTGSDAESSDTITGSASITGTIVDNRNNDITYYNMNHAVDISIQKLDDNGDGLEGAVFQLMKLDNNQSEVQATEFGVGGLSTVSKQIQGTPTTYEYESAFESTGEVQTLTRLTDGTYRLREVHVPDGYINTYGYIQFEIEGRVMKNVTTDNGNTDKLTFTPAGETASLALLEIENEPGTPLPHTGGSGTMLFTVLGSILIAGAVIMLVMQRRRTSE